MDGCCGWLAGWFLPPQVSYEHARSRVRSFDLVYFCQFSKWTGPFVALFSSRMITHMGMVWKHPTTRELYLLEAIRNPDSAPDVLTGSHHTGVRLISFRDMLRDQTHGPIVCIQPIMMEAEMRKQAEARLANFIITKNGVPFEDSKSVYFLARLPRSWKRLHAHEDIRTLFCSELVALALRDCGLLHIDNVSAVIPTTLYECELVLQPGAHLSGNKFLVRAGTAPLLPPRVEVVPADAPAAVEISVEELARRLEKGSVHFSDLVK